MLRLARPSSPPSPARQGTRVTARPLSSRDIEPVLRACAADPIASCMVAARVQQYGLDPRSVGAELWSCGDPEQSLCYSSSNLVPLRGGQADLRGFAERANRRPRMCSSLVGRAELILPLWDMLSSSWGPARELRDNQPLLALSEAPKIPDDIQVRRVRMDELDRYLVAAVAMFTEEVGVDPCSGDGGRSYRRRVGNLIAAGRAWARFDGPRVVFKAEIGSLSRTTGQIQGVWVTPELRGRGLGAAGTAAVAGVIVATGRTASLYVNNYNIAARCAYQRVGFTQVGTFATVLLV